MGQTKVMAQSQIFQIYGNQKNKSDTPAVSIKLPSKKSAVQGQSLPPLANKQQESGTPKKIKPKVLPVFPDEKKANERSNTSICCESVLSSTLVLNPQQKSNQDDTY